MELIRDAPVIDEIINIWRNSLLNSVVEIIRRKMEAVNVRFRTNCPIRRAIGNTRKSKFVRDNGDWLGESWLHRFFKNPPEQHGMKRQNQRDLKNQNFVFHPSERGNPKSFFLIFTMRSSG